MITGMNKIAYLFNRGVHAFNAKHDSNSKRLQDPFGATDLKIKSCHDHHHRDKNLRHNAVFGGQQFKHAFYGVLNAF